MHSPTATVFQVECRCALHLQAKQSVLSFISKGVISPDYSFVFTHLFLTLFLLCNYLDIIQSSLLSSVNASELAFSFILETSYEVVKSYRGDMICLRSYGKSVSNLGSECCSLIPAYCVVQWSIFLFHIVCHFFLIFSFLVADVICFFPFNYAFSIENNCREQEKKSFWEFPWILFYLRQVKIPLALLEFSCLLLLRSPEDCIQRNRKAAF